MMMMRRAALAIAGSMLAGALPASAAVVIDPVVQPIALGLGVRIAPFVTIPATAATGSRAAIQSMRSLGDGSDRMFVNDTRGTISVTTRAGAQPSTWFDIRTQNVGFAETNSQTGLTSFTFHPNYGRDPLRPGYATFYTIYSTLAGSAPAPTYAGNGPVDHHNVVREWTVADPAAATATIASSRELLRVAQPGSDHGAGTIAFNPAAAVGTADYGKLYIGFGDGGGVNDPYDNAQDSRSSFGKILRIDPVDPDGAGPRAYGVPADNPFAGEPGVLGEIWASGLRNPQQFSWDRLTGAMYIADIGQAQLEEVNVGRAGANYGWPLREGTFGRSTDKSQSFVTDDANPGFYVDPVGQYDHDEGSGIGAAQLYRGSALPELFGMMLITDIVNGRIFYFDPADMSGEGGVALLRELALYLDEAATTMLALEGQRGRVDLRMGIDAAGEIYLLTKQDGDIYRIASVIPEPATWATLLAGFALVAMTLRRRRRIASAA
jgi:glucose/arabinose dehydrogenase